MISVRRPDAGGRLGTPANVKINIFEATLADEDKPAYQYNVTLDPGICIRSNPGMHYI